MARKQTKPTARQLDVDDAIAAHGRERRVAWDQYTAELRARLRSIDPAAAGLTPRRWEPAREFLMAVASYAYHDLHGRCQQPAETLLDTARRGTPLLKKVHQLYQARRDCEALGLVGVMRGGVDEDGRREPDILWLDGAAIDELAELSRNQTKPARTRPNQPKPRQTTYKESSSPKGSSDSEFLQSSFSLPLDLPPDTAATTEPAHGTHWTKAEEEVFLFGVDQAAAAVAHVRRYGGQPADVEALVAFCRLRISAWYSPAATLYRRLIRWRQGQPVEALWPVPKPGWRDPAASDAARLRRDREVAELLERRAKFDADRRAVEAERQARAGP